MHDEPSDWVDCWRSAAIEKVDRFIANIPGGTRLPVRDLDRYRRHGCDLGWKVAVDFSNSASRDIHLLACGGFPYNSLRIAVADPPDILTWPHLDASGFLCVLPSEAAVSNENSATVAEYVLGEACRLIEENIHERNIEDFRREFLDYWKLVVGEGLRRDISLLKPEGPGRRVSVWRGQQERIVGESQEALERWLERWGVKKKKDRAHKLYDGVLIWLPETLVPAEYPGTTSDVRALARERSPESVHVLEEIAASGADEIDVILGTQTPNGVCFAAVTVQSPRYAGTVVDRE